jgi:LysM repeat protein
MRKRKTVDWLLKRLRRLLLASGILNICLLTLFFSTWLPSPSFSLPVSRKSVPSVTRHTTSGQLILSFRQMPFEQLVLKLEETEPVECGYLQRDIALSCLASKFHFDVERALQDSNMQTRMVTIQGQEHLGAFPLFPGLGDAEYESLIHFAKTERWPFSAEGMFARLQNSGENLPKSLVNAFIMTKEFKELQRKLSPIKALELVRMMLDVDWTTIEQAQNRSQPLQILLTFVSGGSTTAAKTLLQTESAYALRQLDDGMILNIFDLLGEDHPLAESFAKKLLNTPRGDDVWQLARQKIEEPASVQHQKDASEDFLYVVQKGDSLWKIARKHNARVDELKECNQLESDILRPGKIIKIPS